MGPSDFEGTTALKMAYSKDSGRLARMSRYGRGGVK
jgi:hypothetical protein